MVNQQTLHDSTSLLDALERSLSPSARSVLDVICARASHHHIPLYLVGGSVRDLLLGIPTSDLDFVVEGDALKLALEVGRDLDTQPVTHSRFGTATIKLDGRRYDLVTARKESYSRPGALPTVSPSHMEDDLHRRDFTINTMALSLIGPQRGRLLDPYGGQPDLEHSLIRVLHANSFVDDPTRLLRAVRYEQRLGFHLEAKTLSLLAQAIAQDRLSSVGSDRIRRELGLMLKEPHPHRPLLRSGELSLLDAIFPGLGRGCFVERMGCAGEPEPLAYLAALAYPLFPRQGEAFIRRLNMPRQWARVVSDAIALRLQEEELAASNYAPSQVAQMLDGRVPAALQTAKLLFTHQRAKACLDLYLTRWRYVKSTLNGRDLASLGISSGPLLGGTLGELRRARLDGKVASRQEEIALARQYLTEKGEGALHG